MTHVHYKFSSKLSYDTVVFDGPHITLKDLKRQIMGKEKLRAGDCDLQITNAQTKEEYAEDEGLIPKGSSVIVRRVPIIGGGKSSSSSKTHNTERSDAQLHHAFTAVKSKDGQASTSVNPLFSKISNLADADVSEEDKIRVMLNQSAYDMNYSNKYGTALPSNYTCYRCGNTGHHIRNCPASVSDKSTEAPLRIKKSTGIPRSFMVEVDDPNIKGAMLTNCGRYAIPTIDAEAYAIGKKEKPPFLQQEQPKTETKAVTVPDELLCLICQELLSDAVVIPCCGNSYCDDCIRSALLDSEDHICPNCSQLDVSPDTLIANKFLRQAVNNFKKERGYTRGVTRRCSTSQSRNPTPTTSPVPTPPPPAVQSQPQKPLQSTNSQQEPLVHHPQAADSPPLSGNPPTTTSPSTACNTPNDSLQTEQSCRKTPEKEAEAETHDDLAAAAPSVPVSNKDATAAPSQLIPLVNHTTVAEQPQTAGVSQQQSSLGSIPGQAGPPASWGSSSSSSVCPTGGWTESPQLTSSPSSSYSAAIPPLFPYPLFHTNHSAHQSHSTYPPGYPPTTPIWTIPCPQGAPIPSLCSTSTSSIPSLVPKEWYSHQRKTKERSPQRGSTYGRSSSRSNSKSKSSRSYSRSSSRSGSRSRSRSQGRSRPRSPYSHHRDRHHRSHPSRSYSYGYKRPRSPTPSSSSSPQVDHRSRSKSPSDHRKNRHRSHHHAKKSASSSQSSKRRDERSGREAGGSGAISATSSFTSHSSHTSNMELDRERYLKWKKEYKEWCDKYLSSYVGHFQQLPFPFVNLPPPPPHWEGIKNSVSQVDDRSPSSQSSTDSHSTSSQSSSDSRSSLSLTSNDSQSPPSHLSSDGRSMQSEDKAQQRARHQRQRDKEAELHGRSKGGKRMKCEKKYEKRRMRKHEDGREEESSSPDAAEPTDDRENDTRPQTCGDSGRDKATASDKTLKPAYTSLRPDKSLDKDCGKSSERGNWEREKVSKRSKDSGSRRDVVRQHKIRPSNEEDRVDSGRYRSPGGSKAPDTRSEKNRKRKGENLERSETREAESPDPFDRKEQKTEKKKERKTLPPTEREIWEGGMTVKPQKKISININLEGKRKETTDKQQSNPGESKEEKLNRGHGEGERREFGVEEKGLLKDTVKPVEAGVRPSWEKATFRDDKRETWEKISNAGEKNKDGEGDGVDLWHFAFKELKEGKEQWEGEEMKTSKEDERRSLTRKEETEERLRKGSGGQEMRELVQHFQEENRRNQTEEWKPNETLMEVVKRRTKTEEDDTMRFTLSSNKSSSCDEQRTKFKTLEEFIQNRGEKEDQLVLGQVPWSKRDKYEEEKQNEGGPVVQPSPVVTPTSRETEGENELTRLRSVDGERERGIVQRVNSREKDKNLTLANLDRGVAPSSGKDGTDSTLCTDREKERGMEVEKWRGRERSRDRQKERRRSKEQEKGRERGKEREDSSAASALKKNLPSYGHLSYSTSQDTGEMRERQRGGDLDREKRSGSGGRERSSMSKADKHAQKIYKDSLDKHRDKKHHRDHYKDQDRPTGTHWSSSSFSHTQNNPSPEMKRSDSKEKEGERKRNKVGKVIKESKGERESRGRETEREGGRRWRDEADQLSTWTKWEGGRDLEEGERPSSSSSSSTSQENSEDDRRKERMTKQKHHKTDKNQSALEAREEEDELKKHKRMMKSKRNADGREEDCGGEVDDRWKEEEGRIKLCPVTLF